MDFNRIKTHMYSSFCSTYLGRQAEKMMIVPVMAVYNSVWTFVHWLIRPLIKWFLRKTTKLCELQRTCYGEPAGARRTFGVEFSLLNSKNENINQLILDLNHASDNCQFSGDRSHVRHAIEVVLNAKRIDPRIHSRFIKSFENCVGSIWGYRELYQEIERLRTTPYNADNADHENKLNLLWDRLMPNVPLETRITKQWQDIGFQGDDPKTDFRGMGILGLDNLLFFAQEYNDAALHVLSHSHHPKYGYAFAIVGINLTSMAYHLLKDGAAKTHMYNIVHGVPSVICFHRFYSYLFFEFDRFWIESKPRNVMDFTFIKDKFEKSIRASLENPTTVFRVNISVDNI